ncbi:uncharacterized protein SPAPADRAFT_68091 [Spathaspora passalidarum NRRL Y-27907]|uniref:SH3 domain-containing protein n=1 Tax=Spathaspora passalidarum (strain NRRL Y-27907 / 11-Y1) TaxID=619300 RepID=G3AT94_SPAPN|nr:uncharacterized protein SPAPADRAFT_68091 [Spathaspora passalidarum NRRL Y-27907]EGW30857.1 hypothetical protein SPAPADRAFT_68091 [Spathaspora passalidarum NRRL Y-27907]
MTTSLFKTKQHKFKRKVKDLQISGPLDPNTLTLLSPLSPESNLQKSPHSQRDSRTKARHSYPVLLAKYEFKAERDGQLNIKAGDYLILIERPGNGWLEVHHIDNKESRGLIPASFVDIAVNDCVNPVSLRWLTQFESKEVEEVDTFNNDYFELASDSAFAKNYPIKVVIDKAFQSLSKKFLYKMKVVMTNKDTLYLAKRYQDFYHFHIELMETYPNFHNLPKLPPPLFQVPQSSRLKFDKRFVDDLISITQDLNEYFSQLINYFPEIQKSTEILDFIFGGPYHLTKNSQKVNEEEVNNFLFPNCIDVESYVKSSKSTFSTTAPLPPVTSFKQYPESPRRRSNQYDNSKYSTYINQNQAKEITHSNSTYSLESYTSLIEVYDRDDSASSEEGGCTYFLNTPETSVEGDSTFATPLLK